jgi:catechol 2,3-dioxygenase-like lactoylglutathione lyase family enzyme
MTDPTFILLYVENPEASSAFYADLLGRQPVETSPGFVMFAFDSGLKLGLWARHTVAPVATGTGGGSEIAFVAADRAGVDEIHSRWAGRGIPVLQAPTAMEFGYTFTAADPDGHRLRVFAPGAA